MTRLKKTTTIYAPIERVFEFVDDPNNVAEYSVGVSRVKGSVRTEQRVGDVMALTYTALGIRFDEEFTYTKYEKPLILISKVSGPMSGTFHVTLEREASNQTLVSLEVEYEIATSALRRVMNRLFLEHVNEKNLDRTLGNIKMMVETGWFNETRKEKPTRSQETIA